MWPLRGRELPLGGTDDGRAALVRALVVEHLLGEVVVALVEELLDLVGRLLVIPRPRLVAAQRVDAAEDRRTVRRTALVGVDLREVDLREIG